MNSVLNVLLVLASCIGHTGFWVSVVNRFYARAINFRVLRRLRLIPVVLICGFPILLLARLVTVDSRFLQGGRLAEVSPVTLVLLLLPIPAFVVWVYCVGRWHGSQKRSFHHADRRERFHLMRMATTEQVSCAIRGQGPGIFGLWPLNEVFQLEVNHKTIALRNRTADQGTGAVKLVHLSDLHFTGCPGGAFYRDVIRRAAAMKPDAFLFTGDLIDDMQLLQEACEILSELTRHAPCYFVLGNHDWRYDAAEIRRSLTAAGWIDLGSRALTRPLNGLNVGFAGSEMPWLGSDPPAPSECDLSILLSHSPDQVQFARQHGFDLMVSGHTHGGQVVLPIAGPVFSPSRFGVRYASGLFRESGLVLHVSRGVGANDPLRWNCLPELTCLDVRLTQCE